MLIWIVGIAAAVGAPLIIGGLWSIPLWLMAGQSPTEKGGFHPDLTEGDEAPPV